jgi:hypothetical protein
LSKVNAVFGIVCGASPHYLEAGRAERAAKEMAEGEANYRCSRLEFFSESSGEQWGL